MSRLGDVSVLSLHVTPDWDPHPVLGPISTCRVLTVVTGLSAGMWRVADGRVVPHLVRFSTRATRHWPGHLTCITLARALATVFVGSNSGNIYAFDARVEKRGEEGQEEENRWGEDRCTTYL